MDVRKMYAPPDFKSGGCSKNIGLLECADHLAVDLFFADFL